MDPMTEIMASQIPDAEGKLWVPDRDVPLRLQGPVSLRAFFTAIRIAKKVEVTNATAH